MRRNAFAIVLVAASVGSASAADMPSLDRGRLLYENHCTVCHTPNIHRRPDRIPLDAKQLRAIVVQWQQSEQLHWSAQDVEDVVEFLRRTRYRF